MTDPEADPGVEERPPPDVGDKLLVDAESAPGLFVLHVDRVSWHYRGWSMIGHIVASNCSKMPTDRTPPTIVGHSADWELVG